MVIQTLWGFPCPNPHALANPLRLQVPNPHNHTSPLGLSMPQPSCSYKPHAAPGSKPSQPYKPSGVFHAPTLMLLQTLCGSRVPNPHNHTSPLGFTAFLTVIQSLSIPKGLPPFDPVREIQETLVSVGLMLMLRKLFMGGPHIVCKEKGHRCHWVKEIKVGDPGGNVG
jgi:hypothetical protein